MATDVRTVAAGAFVSGHDALQTLLVREAERVDHRINRGKGEAQENAGLRRARREPFDGREVPEAFRPFVRLARRWGIGDDALPGHALSKITRAERAELRRKLPPKVRASIGKWLASFRSGAGIPAAGTRFDYLLEAYDEVFV